MISTCTLFFTVSMTQPYKFVLSHYMNVMLILRYNNCCQNKLISVSVSVSISTARNMGLEMALCDINFTVQYLSSINIFDIDALNPICTVTTKRS